MGKKDIKSIVVFIVVIVLVIVGILCFKSVMETENEYKTIETTIAKVQEESIEDSKTIVLEKGDAGEVKTVTSNNNTGSKDNSSTYDSQNLPNINLSKVREINKDVVGWLYVPNTNINYPILKGTSNDSYIKTDIYKRKSSAGSIFMDYQNDSKFYDKNTIIYGHNMKNKSMFHNLRYFLNKSFRQKNLNIYIFGHSLDVTDEDILRRFILDEYKKALRREGLVVRTTIFHFNQNALGKQIANLVKVIGQDNLISMVHGSDARIILQQQQDAKNVEAEKKEE